VKKCLGFGIEFSDKGKQVSRSLELIPRTDIDKSLVLSGGKNQFDIPIAILEFEVALLEWVKFLYTIATLVTHKLEAASSDGHPLAVASASAAKEKAKGEKE
jgi:hypothetical protein